jgi:RHS repeat-associated protein
MESAQIQALYEPPLAAMPQLSKKPRQGFETRKRAWNPGPNSCNFTVTLGLRATVVENGVRETYSARYYNPATGRFLSRDPEEGIADDPATLHKYLYANGDPVNAFDPTGKAVKPGLTFEYGMLIGTIAARVVVQLSAVACAVDAVWELTSLILEQVNKHRPEGSKFPEPPPIPTPLHVTCVIAPGASALGFLLGLLFGIGPG